MASSVHKTFLIIVLVYFSYALCAGIKGDTESVDSKKDDTESVKSKENDTESVGSKDDNDEPAESKKSIDELLEKEAGGPESLDCPGWIHKFGYRPVSADNLYNYNFAKSREEINDETQSIWNGAYARFILKSDHYIMPPVNFCLLFSKNMKRTVFMSRRITVLTCPDWIYLNGYVEDEGNLKIAISHKKYNLDIEISTWASAFSYYLVTNDVDWTPKEFCYEFLELQETFTATYNYKVQKLVDNINRQYE